MKRRMGYFGAFGAILAIEICIGLFVRDNFVRPYVGDMLVTVLLCCGVKAVFPALRPAGPVFLFSAAVEGMQALHLVEKWGLQGTVFGVMLGSTFDWMDLLCYGIGCVAFAGTQWVLQRKG